jgi:hypothetical protein
LNIDMGETRQVGLRLDGEVEKRVLHFAKLFHRGQVAAAARVLIEDALLLVRTDDDYLEALRRTSAGAEAGVDTAKRARGRKAG